MEDLEKGMTPVLLEDLGLRYPTKKSKRKHRYGLYQCQYCGKEWESMISSIKSGLVKSCGCLSKNNNISHGLGYHPLYKTWIMMKHRCYDSKTVGYENYGGRGIKVCERWLDIKNFVEDMYPSWEEGLTLDRINTNGNYEIDNCRWSDKKTQARNTRDICKNNTSRFRGVTFNKRATKWKAQIKVNSKSIYLGYYTTALEAAKAYETYVRLNNLEHNFTPALTPEEIEELNKQKDIKNEQIIQQKR